MLEECGEMHPPTSYGVPSYNSSGDGQNFGQNGHQSSILDQIITPFKRHLSDIAKLPSLHNFLKFDLCDLEK
jgi:hypothetical protein